MNESDIEKKLRSLKPASPSRSLEPRIARDLEGQPGGAASGVIAGKNPSWLSRVLAPLGWAGAGAAVAVAVMLSLNRAEGGQQQPALTQNTRAALAENGGDVQHEMLDVADEGILDDDTSGPSRIVRYTTLERRQWSEPGGAITLVEVPREDVVLVPIAFQ
jgi:hypothetical protein